MAAAFAGYRMVLIMPEDLSPRGAGRACRPMAREIILTLVKGGMEYARDLADTSWSVKARA